MASPKCNFNTSCLDVTPGTSISLVLGPTCFYNGIERSAVQHSSLTPTFFYPLDCQLLRAPIVATPFADSIQLCPIIRWILYILSHLSCLLWRSHNLPQILSKPVHKPKQNNSVLVSLINTNCPKKSQSCCTISTVFTKGKALNHNALFHLETHA